MPCTDKAVAVSLPSVTSTALNRIRQSKLGYLAHRETPQLSRLVFFTCIFPERRSYNTALTCPAETGTNI